MEQQAMRIREVAARSRVNVQTLRYYEQQGLLPKPPRTESNYRLYTGETVQRVRFVKRAQALGISRKNLWAKLKLHGLHR
jgi:MerR family mercuric resistance operon transcriptional regulator